MATAKIFLREIITYAGSNSGSRKGIKNIGVVPDN